jgi:hypothetical protein
MKGGTLYNKFGNLGKALEYAYPEINWIPAQFFSRRKKSEQRLLRVNLQQVLPPSTDIVEEPLLSRLQFGSEPT